MTPKFKVFRFTGSGKFKGEFIFEAELAKQMDQVCDSLRSKLYGGGSLVIVSAENEEADQFFYPCEIKNG